MNLKQAFIDNNSIRLGLSADTWQEAVQLAVQPLIDSKAVTSAYYDAIIASTEKYYSLLCVDARYGYAPCRSRFRR